MNTGWSLFIIVITVGNIAGALWLLYWTSKGSPQQKAPDAEVNDENTTGHVWDEDLREYNNPLPRWWLGLFYITVVFAVVYLALYPGLGRFSGVLNWSQVQRYESQVEDANKKYAETFNAFAEQDIQVLANDPEARKTGQRLFVNHCAGCHGSDARGAAGFPNLRDDDWLYGNSPEAIKTSIAQGRSGIMPPLGSALGEKGVEAVVAYVQGLNTQVYNSDLYLQGKQLFATYCAACHGTDARGNQMLGAPNLSDDTWLYGRSDSAIQTAIMQGRSGKMPAHKDLMTAEKIHVLTAYIYSLSNQQD